MSGGISPILIGGLVPAFLFGLGSTLQRGSNGGGIDPGQIGTRGCVLYPAGPTGA